MKCIIILNHLSKDNILYHYNWHKQICDCKVVWQTTEKINHNDIFTIDIPGKIVIPNVMRILCHYALKFNYDYYCLMAGDCFILKKNFFDYGIELLKKTKSNICFTHLDNNKEHYKSLFDKMIVKNYNIKETQIKWSLNICNIVTKEAVKYYLEKSHFKIYDEADFPNVFTTSKFKSILHPDIDYRYFNAADLARVYGGRIKGLVDANHDPSIIHAVKNYKLLTEYNIVLK